MKQKKHIKTTDDRAEIVLSPEKIRERAYRIYLARGANPGNAIDDWLRAERELSAKMAPH